ncbi:Ig-like domain-containing protein [Streptomyces sp. NPDC091292]|uniref:Ig-like domain-containing protein n=1 Tax=Streptomyces sp. NPDC091292 TaxID=3365991 RepID=UPI0037FA77D4
MGLAPTLTAPILAAPRRTLAAVLSAAVGAVVLLGAGAPDARADTLGTLTANPATGTDTTSMSLTTSGACPAEADHVIVKVNGKGFPAEGQNVVGTSPVELYPGSGAGFEVPLTSTMRDYASLAGFTTLEGQYEYTLTCRKAFGAATYGDFKGSVWFTSNTTYRNTPPPVAQTTATTLTTSPGSPVTQGTSVKLTAKVAPTTAPGTVQFLDGTAKVGSPVTVSAGTATLTTSTLAVGAHSLKAQFAPANTADYTGSTSAAVPFTVTVRPPTVTSPPKVTGTAKVGSKVTCAVTFKDATSVAYQWLRDGASISGATASTRVLSSTDRTHKVSCRATGKNSGGSTPATSPAVTVGTGVALKVVKAPSITGTPSVGKTLTVKSGTWTPAATSYSYVWKRDGRTIGGATKTTYKAVKADKGHLLTVTVTAKRAGHANGTATTKSVRVR